MLDFGDSIPGAKILIEPENAGLTPQAEVGAFFGSVSIRVRLTLAFGVILLLFLATVLTTYDNYQKVAAARAEIVRSLKIILLVNEVNVLTYARVVSGGASAVVSSASDPAALDPLVKYLVELGELIGADDVTGRARLDALLGAMEDWNTMLARGKPVLAAESRVLVAVNLLQRDIQGYQQERLSEQEALQGQLSESLQLELMVMLLAGLTVGIVAMAYSNRRISDPLVGLSGQMREVAVGRTGIEIQEQSRSDEIGTVARALEVFRKARVLADVEAGNKARLMLELKSANSELEASTAKLARASQFKSEFMATVSHELRTPLTSIRGSLGLIIGGAVGELGAQARNLLAIAQSNADRLLALINDLLDVEKIESGRIELTQEPMDLVALVDNAIMANHGYAQKHKVSFALVERPADRVGLPGDPRRMTQVVTNLLSNAAKYAPEGSTVEVRIIPTGTTVRVAVHDSGPGVPKDFRDRIFQKFSQADSSDRRTKGGTGLGLAICKAIIEQHGGEIGYDSMPGDTTFWFDLTLDGPSRRKSKARVLVLEHDEDTADLLMSLLRKYDYDPSVAVSVAATRIEASRRSYDVLLLGHVPPGEDGQALLRELRAREPWDGLQILLVPKSARDASVYLDRVLRDTAAQSGAGEPVEILHVEDDPDMAAMLRKRFGADARLTVVAGVAGARGLIAEKVFPMVILDLELADGSGYELLPDLQTRSRKSNVVIYSAHDSKPFATRQISAILTRGSWERTHELPGLLQTVLGASGAAP